MNASKANRQIASPDPRKVDSFLAGAGDSTQVGSDLAKHFDKLLEAAAAVHDRERAPKLKLVRATVDLTPGLHFAATSAAALRGTKLSPYVRALTLASPNIRAQRAAFLSAASSDDEAQPLSDAQLTKLLGTAAALKVPTQEAYALAAEFHASDDNTVRATVDLEKPLHHGVKTASGMVSHTLSETVRALIVSDPMAVAQYQHWLSEKKKS